MLVDAVPLRRPRADAKRNRQKLLDAAKAAFTADGPSASLEEIARTASVGIGTLYRHFPSRDALIAEVYRRAIAELADEADRLLETQPPVEALRRWMMLFVDYLATKKLMASALEAMPGGTAELYAASGPLLKSTIGTLIERAVGSGRVTFAMEPLDLLRAISGIAHASPGKGWEASARQLVTLLVEGMMVRDGR